MTYFVLYFGKARMVSLRFLSGDAAKLYAHTINRFHSAPRAYVVAYSDECNVLTMFDARTSKFYGKG